MDRNAQAVELLQELMAKAVDKRLNACMEKLRPVVEQQINDQLSMVIEGHETEEERLIALLAVDSVNTMMMAQAICGLAEFLNDPGLLEPASMNRIKSLECLAAVKNKLTEKKKRGNDDE